MMLKSLLPNLVKQKFPIDDFRLRLILNTNETKKCTKTLASTQN